MPIPLDVAAADLSRENRVEHLNVSKQKPAKQSTYGAFAANTLNKHGLQSDPSGSAIIEHITVWPTADATSTLLFFCSIAQGLFFNRALRQVQNPTQQDD